MLIPYNICYTFMGNTLAQDQKIMVYILKSLLDYDKMKNSNTFIKGMYHLSAFIGFLAYKKEIGYPAKIRTLLAR